MVPNSVVLNVSILSHDSPAGDEDTHSAGTGASRARAPRAAPARAGGRSSLPARIRSARRRASAGSSPASWGESDRNSSSTSPADEQLGVQMRSALTQQGAHVQALAQLGRRGGQVERAVLPACAYVLHVGGGLGEARLGRGQDRDLRLGVGQQRDVAGQPEAGGDDAGERLLAQAALAAQAAGLDPARSGRSARRARSRRPPSRRPRPCAARGTARGRHRLRSAPSARRAWRDRRAVLTMFSSTYGRRRPSWLRRPGDRSSSPRPATISWTVAGWAGGSRRLSMIGTGRWRPR